MRTLVTAGWAWPRTGLETPPGISRRARSRRSRERLEGAPPRSAISIRLQRRVRNEGRHELREAAHANVRRRHPAGPTDTGAVHPGDPEAGLARAENVRHRVVGHLDDRLRL